MRQYQPEKTLRMWPEKPCDFGLLADEREETGVASI